MLPMTAARGSPAPRSIEGVEVVLRVEGGRPSRASPGEQAETADAPVAAGRGQLVEVHRQVGAVEAADADVDDARASRAAVVRSAPRAARGDAAGEAIGVQGDVGCCGSGADGRRPAVWPLTSRHDKPHEYQHDKCWFRVDLP